MEDILSVVVETLHKEERWQQFRYVPISPLKDLHPMLASARYNIFNPPSIGYSL